MLNNRYTSNFIGGPISHYKFLHLEKCNTRSNRTQNKISAIMNLADVRENSCKIALFFLKAQLSSVACKLQSKGPSFYATVNFLLL